MKFYLAGPIANVSVDEATQWRLDAQKGLAAYGIGVNDPNKRLYRPGIEAEIITKDLEEIRKSDGVIAHVPLDVSFHGTSMEIFFAAYVLRIPVYTFPVNPTPWLIHWTTQFDNLNEIINYIRDIDRGRGQWNA